MEEVVQLPLQDSPLHGQNGSFQSFLERELNSLYANLRKSNSPVLVYNIICTLSRRNFKTENFPRRRHEQQVNNKLPLPLSCTDILILLILILFANNKYPATLEYKAKHTVVMKERSEVSSQLVMAINTGAG